MECTRYLTSKIDSKILNDREKVTKALCKHLSMLRCSFNVNEERHVEGGQEGKQDEISN